MNPYSRSEVKSSKHLSIETSLLGDSMLNSMSLAGLDPAVESQLIQKTDGSNSNGRATSIFSNIEDAIEVKVVDGNNLNRDSMTPNTIIVTRAELDAHGEVPLVESTDMGPVMFCHLIIKNGLVDFHVHIATEESLSLHKLEWDYCIKPELKRLEVGTLGLVPLIDHDFESGDEINLNGERVKSIFVHGGIDVSDASSELTGPTLFVLFKDRPSITEYKVGYIRLECKPIGKKGKYFQVFQCPGDH